MEHAQCVAYKLGCVVTDLLQNKKLVAPFPPTLAKALRNHLMTGLDYTWLMASVPIIPESSSLLGRVRSKKPHAKAVFRPDLLKVADDASHVHLFYEVSPKQPVDLPTLWRELEGDLTDGWGEGVDQTARFGEFLRYEEERDTYVRAKDGIPGEDNRYMLTFHVLHVGAVAEMTRRPTKV